MFRGEEEEEVEEPRSGISHIIFPLERRYGAAGDVNVTWEVSRLSDDNDDVDDLLRSEGSAMFFALAKF